MQRRCTALALMVGGLVAAMAGAAPGRGAAAPAVVHDPLAVAAQRITLRVGILPVTGFLGLYVAREWGWLEEEGITLDLQVMAGGAEIVPAMIGGSLDVGIVNTFTHVLARDQGFDVKAVAVGIAERRGEPIHAILVRPDAPIQSARDLEGRTLAVNTLNNIDHLMQQVWLQNNGADPRRVSFVEIPFPQHPVALMQGRVDAIGPAEPFVTVAQSQGARVLAYHYTDTNEVTLLSYYGALGDWIARNTDTVRRFARALHRVSMYLESNPEEKRAAAVRYLNLTPDVAARVRFEELQTRVDPELVQWWIDAGRRFGLVNNPLNPADFLYETVR